MKEKRGLYTWSLIKLWSEYKAADWMLSRKVKLDWHMIHTYRKQNRAQWWVTAERGKISARFLHLFFFRLHRDECQVSCKRAGKKCFPVIVQSLWYFVYSASWQTHATTTKTHNNKNMQTLSKYCQVKANINWSKIVKWCASYIPITSLLNDGMCQLYQGSDWPENLEMNCQ